MKLFIFIFVFVVDCFLVNVNINDLQTPDPTDLSLLPGQLPPVGVQRFAALYINHRYQTLRQRLIQHKRNLWIYHIGQSKCLVIKELYKKENTSIHFSACSYSESNSSEWLA